VSDTDITAEIVSAMAALAPSKTVSLRRIGKSLNLSIEIIVFPDAQVSQ
jgi:hypothetical protein